MKRHRVDLTLNPSPPGEGLGILLLLSIIFSSFFPKGPLCGGERGWGIEVHRCLIINFF
jgi:hypothetical protein